MISKQDREMAHNLRELVRQLRRRMRKQISNPEQLSFAELKVLAQLTEGDHLPSELCTQLNMSSQYMSQVLNGLEKLGYIARKVSSEDRRKSYALLTETGRLKVSDARREGEEWLAALIAKHYTREDKKIIRQAMDLLGLITEL